MHDKIVISNDADALLLEIGPYQLGRDYFRVTGHMDVDSMFRTPVSIIKRHEPKTIQYNNGTHSFTGSDGTIYVTSHHRAPGLENILRTNGWGGYMHVPFSNDGGQSMRQIYEDAALRNKLYVSIPILKFVELAGKVDPNILIEVQEKLGMGILDLREVAADYNGACFVGEILMENMERFILKITGAEKIERLRTDGKFLSNAMKHEKFRGLVAGPKLEYERSLEKRYLLKEHAEDMQSGKISSGFADPVLHALYFAALLHTWGNEIYDAPSEKNRHNYRKSYNQAEFLDRIVHGPKGLDMPIADYIKLMSIYDDALGSLSSRKKDSLTHRDTRGANWVNGRIVDADSIAYFPSESVDIAHILLQYKGLRMHEEGISEYYLAWYNLMRTKEECSKLGQTPKLGEVLQYVNMADLHKATLIEAVNWAAYDARDRTHNNKSNEFLQCAKKSSELIYIN